MKHTEPVDGLPGDTEIVHAKFVVGADGVLSQSSQETVLVLTTSQARILGFGKP